MSIPCFHYADLTEQTLIGTVIELSPSESAHALQSRRLQVGADIRVINGAGLTADGIIYQVNRRQLLIELRHISALPRPATDLTLAVAMPKGERQKSMVDVLTQLGVSTLIPIKTEFSVSQMKASQLEKLKRVSIEACKQSQNPWALNITSVQNIDAVLQYGAFKYYTDQNGVSWKSAISNLHGHDKVLVFIGPEGGFSGRERALFNRHNASALTLGRHILRTESAAIAAAALFKC